MKRSFLSNNYNASETKLENVLREKSNPGYMLVILGILITTFLAVSSNFLMPYLWFDEAGQFYIAKGLTPDDNPFAQSNGMAAVIENNRLYNLDPGGFSILLHFWTYVSNHNLWLRLLPLLFFFGVVLSFIYLSYMWLKNTYIALLMGLILLLIPEVPNMAYELRAYSMESLGTVLSIIALERLKLKLTNKRLFLWGCIFAFFMTSRYSEIIVIAVVSLYILFLIFKSQESYYRKLISVVVYSLPLITMLLYIYFFALRYQSQASGIQALNYLRYLNNDITILLEPLNFLVLCFVGLIPVLLLLKNRYPVFRRYETLLTITFLINIAFIVLSLTGKYPWDMYSNRSISAILTIALCFCAFLGELLNPLLKSPKVLKYYLFLILLITAKGILFPKVDHKNTYYSLKRLDLSEFREIYVDRWESPCIKYLFEYGQLKSKQNNIYPDKFTFLKLGPSSSRSLKNQYREFYNTKPDMNDLLQYDLLIVPEMIGYSTKNDKWQLLAGTCNFYVKIPHSLNNTKTLETSQLKRK